MPAVYPLVVLPSTFRGHYPNMAKRDASVWARFLTLYADRYEGFAYDVAMGGILPALPMESQGDLKAWQYKTALRIDAVAFTPDAATIIEVKPEAHVSALGAVVGYTLIADRERVFDRRIRGAIVCEYIQPDVDWACGQLDIAVYVV